MIRTGRFVIKKVGDGYMYELQASNYSAIAESPVYTTLESAKRSIHSVSENAKSVPVQDNTVEEIVKYPNPKFEIFRQDDFYFFRFRAGNGKMTISSQVYTTKEACKNGVTSVQNHIGEAAVCIETPDGVITLEEYTALEEKRIAEGGEPTILDPNDVEDFDAAPDDVDEGEKGTRPGRFVIYCDDKGFRFELLAANFSSIADSPTYSTLDSAKRSIRSLKEYASGVPVQDNTVEKIEKQSNPKFEIFAEGEDFVFRFRAKNGKQTISSQVYSSKDGCRNGIESVQKHVKRAEVYIETDEGCIPIEEYTAIRVAIFNASVFKKRKGEETNTLEEPALFADNAAEEQASAEKAAPIVEETPVEEVAPVVEEAPAEEETTPAVEEAPAADEAPAEEVAPAEEETPAEEVTPAAEEVPAEEVAPAEEEASAEEEVAPVTDEAPAEEETPAEEEVPAEEETVEELYDVEEVPEDEEAPAEEEAQAEPAAIGERPAPTGSAAKKPGFKNFLARLFFGK